MANLRYRIDGSRPAAQANGGMPRMSGIPCFTRCAVGSRTGKRRKTAMERNAQMAENLNGKKVAFLVANEGVEQIELTEPWKAVERAGGEPVLIAPEAGTTQAFNHLQA